MQIPQSIMMENKLDEKEIQKTRIYFLVSVISKGLISLTEVVAGLFVIFVPVTSITAWVINLAQVELLEEPGDFVATHLMHLAQTLTVPSNAFIAFYLLSRGVIRLFLVLALLKDYLWAYPSSLSVLGLFIIYQLYQLSIGFSAVVLALTIFDLIVMWFIWKEYKIVHTRDEARIQSKKE
jgi:uncharacterized membrane protein